MKKGRSRMPYNSRDKEAIERDERDRARLANMLERTTTRLADVPRTRCWRRGGVDGPRVPRDHAGDAGESNANQEEGDMRKLTGLSAVVLAGLAVTGESVEAQSVDQCRPSGISASRDIKYICLELSEGFYERYAAFRLTVTSPHGSFRRGFCDVEPVRDAGGCAVYYGDPVKLQFRCPGEFAGDFCYETSPMQIVIEGSSIEPVFGFNDSSRRALKTPGIWEIAWRGTATCTREDDSTMESERKCYLR